eukprot:8105840-Ditylum_brightwellii.AAC.2
MDAIVAPRKKEQAIVQKRKERRVACNHLRRLREEMEEEDDLDRESHPTKIRRVKDKTYDPIGTIKIVKSGYLPIPDNMWARELSEEEKKFVISYNAKIRYCELTDNIDIPSRFRKAIKEGRKSSNLEGKVLRHKIAINLGNGVNEDKE